MVGHQMEAVMTKQTDNVSTTVRHLFELQTGDSIRIATPAEEQESDDAVANGDPCGAFEAEVNGKLITCFVPE